MPSRPWIALGSSDSARVFAERCFMDMPHADVVTTNDGIAICEELDRVPTCVWLMDAVATHRFCEIGKRMQARGATLATLRRRAEALRMRMLDHFDEFVELTGPRATVLWERGIYSDISMSGLFCCMYALNHGADELHVVGQEGYRPDSDGVRSDHFNGRPGPRSGAAIVRERVEPFMQCMVRVCPDVRFVFYGDLRYSVSGHNVTIVSEVPSATSV